MTTTRYPLTPAMTAIAAVIGLTSTPLLAQTDPAPAASLPVIAAPPPSASPEVTPVTPAVPQGSSSTGLSSVTVPDLSTAAAAPVPETSEPARPSARVAAEAMPTQAAAKPVASKPVAAPAAAPKVAEITPAPAFSPAPDPVPTPAPMAERPAVAPPAARSESAARSDDTLPIAGAAGLGLLALIGGAFALGRRKRADEWDGRDERAEMLEPAPGAIAEPVPAPLVAPPVVPVDSAPVPDGFDTSQFGRHVQAAYAGPTPDNPSLSLRRRLKRAAFFDLQERRTAARPMASPRAETASPATDAPRTATQPVKRTRASWKPFFRPVFQS